MQQRSSHQSILPVSIILAVVACTPDVTETSLKESRSGRPFRIYTANAHPFSAHTPLLIALHAYRTKPQVLVNNYSLKRKAVASRGWLLAVPEGKKDDSGHYFWNAAKACCAMNASARPDDTAYLRGVIRDVKQKFGIEAKQVFAIGVSNGAFMAYRLACAPQTELSAVVAISGAGPGPKDAPCNPQRGIDILHIHGDRDDVIQYRGKHTGDAPYPSADETVQNWVGINEITTPPTDETTWSPVMGSVRRKSWRHSGRIVRFWTMMGESHRLWQMRFAVDSLLDFFEESMVPN